MEQARNNLGERGGDACGERALSARMNATLVRPLPEGRLDILGDVHGERSALEALVDRLGYTPSGRHRKGRHLVLVGDLCDRGPDSPGVIRLVQSWVDAGRAHVIAGNHELNLLRRDKKHGNHWFFGKSFDPEHPEFGHCVAIAAEEQDPILDFLRSLPIALERSDLRITHAAWIESTIDACRRIAEPLDAAYRAFEARLRRDPKYRTLKAPYDEELNRLGDALEDETKKPVAAAIGPYDAFCQMSNPVRVVTSGVEQVARRPFFASGKWRYVDRVPWWRKYPGKVPVLFGHYWRWWHPSIHKTLSKGEPQLFTANPAGRRMSRRDRAFCIDFSVGSRFKQRHLGHEPPYHGRLAAMRWPERELVFDGEEPRLTKRRPGISS
jgi:hypothetical protein